MFPLRTLFWLLIPKKQRFVPFVFRRFLLFLRWLLFRASLPLEWKFIEFSGLFHCLIIKVLFACFSQATLLLYHIISYLSSTFLKKFFKFFSMCCCSLEQLAYLTTTRFVCQPIFLSFSNFFNFPNCLFFSLISNASLSYHKLFCLSTTFLTFFISEVIHFRVTPTGIEPVLPPWKGDVLTAWPRSHFFVVFPTTRLILSLTFHFVNTYFLFFLIF